ncbi:hypothetical protein [Piscinibacter sp.]|nr:hypothetical protein [Albitalea sp.]HUG23693.1 hypothetical protein [Albitalea sp.]
MDRRQRQPSSDDSPSIEDKAPRAVSYRPARGRWPAPVHPVRRIL